MADILVTGGRGFIGTNLTNELRPRGHNVWTCDILQSEVVPGSRDEAVFSGLKLI